MSNRDEIVKSYDEYVTESRETGVSYQDLIMVITDEFIAKHNRGSVSIPETSSLSVDELIYDSVRFHVQQTRQQRRQYLKDVFEDIGDKHEFPPGHKAHEAAKRRLIRNFSRAFPLGVDEGKDKALGMWHIPDVERSIESRRENLQKQRAALELFEASAARAVRALGEGESWS